MRPTIVLYVRGTQAAARVSQWVRALTPTVLLLISPVPPESRISELTDLIVDNDDGPLAVARKVAEVARRMS